MDDLSAVTTYLKSDEPLLLSVISLRRTLEENENGSSDDGDEVERKIHEVPDDGLGTELLEGALDDLSKLLHWIATGLDLATFADHVRGVASNESAIEGVKERILKEPVPRYHVGYSSTLVKDQENRGKDCKRTVDEDKESEVRQVGEGEHASDDADGQGDVGAEA